ncbi:MAG: hypothetical protein ABL983_15530 [Nitrospira sp.]
MVTTIYRLPFDMASGPWCWWRHVTWSLTCTVGVAVLLLWGCSMADADSSSKSKAMIASVYTDLTSQLCRKEADMTDPNETPYLVCSGAEGYALIVRRVDAGRRSIDVVDPSQQSHPLNYHEVVTRHMFSLGPKAEWRVATNNLKRVPLALIVRLQAREDHRSPDRVTHTYLAVAKITSNEVCVTDRILLGTRSEAEVRRAADSAREKPCAPHLLPMAIDGTTIR